MGSSQAPESQSFKVLANVRRVLGIFRTFQAKAAGLGVEGIPLAAELEQIDT